MESAYVHTRESTLADELSALVASRVWARALSEVQRSPLKLFRVGAVLFDSDGVLAGGCAHHSGASLASCCTVHAEAHALQRAGRTSVGADLLVVAAHRTGKLAASSLPCAQCARMLARRGIDRVIFHHAGRPQTMRAVDLAALDVRPAGSGDRRYARNFKLMLSA